MEKTLIAVLVAASIVLVAGLWYTYSSSPGSYEMSYDLEVPTENVEKDLHLDEFFFANNLCSDIFGILALIDEISVEEKAEILHKMMNNLSYKEAVVLKIHNYKNGNALWIGLILTREKEGNGLILVTNYDLKRDRIILREKYMKNCYARFYYIIGDKLVNINDMYSKEREEECREKTVINVASLYLHDDIPENDDDIETILLDELEKTDDVQLKFIATVTLAEYYSSINNEKLFQYALGKAHKLQIDNYSQLNTLDFDFFYKMTVEVNEIVKLMKNINEEG